MFFFWIISVLPVYHNVILETMTSICLRLTKGRNLISRVLAQDFSISLSKHILLGGVVVVWRKCQFAQGQKSKSFIFFPGMFTSKQSVQYQVSFLTLWSLVNRLGKVIYKDRYFLKYRIPTLWNPIKRVQSHATFLISRFILLLWLAPPPHLCSPTCPSVTQGH